MMTIKQIETAVETLKARGWVQAKKLFRYRVFAHPQNKGQGNNIYVGKLSLRKGPNLKSSWPIRLKTS